MTAPVDPAADPAVRVEALRFGYPDGTVALDGPTLEARRGEILGLLGPNGCGKTTLLRAIASAAQRSVPGVSRVEGTPALALDTPVFQTWLTGRENAVALLRLRGVPADRASEAVAEGLKRLGVAAAADRPVSSYSRGTAHRLGLAVALASDAVCLLLDEPLAGLDPSGRERVGLELRAAADAGRCVILSTHDPEFAAVRCDRVGFMAGGRLLGLDTPAAFIAEQARDATIEVRFAPEGHPSGPTDAVEAAEPPPARIEGDTATYHAPDPSTFLPDLLARLFERGATIASVRVREPGLREAYFSVTGVELGRRGSARS